MKVTDDPAKSRLSEGWGGLKRGPAEKRADEALYRRVGVKRSRKTVRWLPGGVGKVRVLSKKAKDTARL